MFVSVPGFCFVCVVKVFTPVVAGAVTPTITTTQPTVTVNAAGSFKVTVGCVVDRRLRRRDVRERAWILLRLCGESVHAGGGWRGHSAEGSRELLLRETGHV